MDKIKVACFLLAYSVLYFFPRSLLRRAV